MSAVANAANALEDALNTAAGIRVYRDPGATVDPPGVVMGAPTLHWDLLDAAPNRATFQLYVISTENDRALERLWDLVPAVVAAASTYDRAAVGDTATSGSFNSGGVDLPAYTISVDVALEGD